MLAGHARRLVVFPALSSVGGAAGRHAVVDRRGARPAGRHRHVRAGPGAPGAERRERTERWPRRALLPRPGRPQPAQLTTASREPWSSARPSQIGWGLAAGVAVGLAGGALPAVPPTGAAGWRARGGRRSRWPRRSSPTPSAQALGGSGFIAAFVGGVAFRRRAAPAACGHLQFTEDAGGLLAAVTWVGFGALALGKELTLVTWQVALYAVLSLTVVRMLAGRRRHAAQPRPAPHGGLPRLVRTARPGLDRLRPDRPRRPRARRAAPVHRRDLSRSLSAWSPTASRRRRSCASTIAGTWPTRRPGPRLRKPSPQRRRASVVSRPPTSSASS